MADDAQLAVADVTSRRTGSVAGGILPLVAVLVLFALATLVLFRPWMGHLHSALLGPPEDNMGDLWNTWYAAVAHQPGDFFHTKLIRFPEGTSLYYQSFAYPKVFVIAALTSFTGSDPGTLVYLQNLSLLASFPLSGLGAFLLVRHLTSSTTGALLGGFVYAFNPSHVAHVMHHAQVSSIEFIPFFVLAYLLAIERRSLGWLGVATVLYALNALSFWYYLFYIGYFILFHAIYVAVRDRAWPRGWNLFAPIACALGTAALLLPLLAPMVEEAMSGAPIYARDIEYFGADLVAYVTFPPTHLLGGLTAGIYERLTGNEWENTVYLGLANLAVLVWLLRRAEARDGALLRYVLSGAALFIILASGHTLHVLGPGTVPLPDALLSQLPFFANVRTPSRAIVFVYLFLAIGIGLAGALADRRRSGPLVALMAIAAAGLIVLDFLPVRLEMTPVSCAPELNLIRDDPERDFGVLNLPTGYVAGEAAMLQQLCHGRPIVQGQTARNVAYTLRDRLEMNDLQAQRRQLIATKVKYVVISPDTRSIFRWKEGDASREAYDSVYEVVARTPSMTILRAY